MKDLERIIKKVAKRYGVKYDPSLDGPMLRKENGTIEALDITKLEKLFLNADTKRS